jgi:hypothetical protein
MQFWHCIQLERMRVKDKTNFKSRHLIFWAILFAILLFCFAHMFSSEMASENYRISSSVHSAGGVPTESENFQMNGTVRQSSPLMDSIEPPISDTMICMRESGTL